MVYLYLAMYLVKSPSHKSTTNLYMPKYGINQHISHYNLLNGNCVYRLLENAMKYAAHNVGFLG